MADRVLAVRELNRALLARQGLLERTRTPVPEMVERLVGMQAQVPWNPYIALWSRIEGFAPADLSDLVAGHALARTTAMRATLHLLTSRDLRSLVPLMAPVAWKGFVAPFGPLAAAWWCGTVLQQQHRESEERVAVPAVGVVRKRGRRQS
jgi:Winged helix DNA-binding domain